MEKQTGFTLIEIAIVLVIIGLLLGGVLKGQELITSARVRNIVSQQDGVKAAYFGFLDRYRRSHTQHLWTERFFSPRRFVRRRRFHFVYICNGLHGHCGHNSHWSFS